MSERVEYHIGHWPGRKLPMLTRHVVGSAESSVIARFVSDEAAETFMREMRVQRVVVNGDE